MAKLSRKSMVDFIICYHVFCGAYDCKYDVKAIRQELNFLPIGELYRKYVWARDADD